jgi:hypothetical protein
MRRQGSLPLPATAELVVRRPPIVACFDPVPDGAFSDGMS